MVNKPVIICVMLFVLVFVGCGKQDEKKAVEDKKANPANNSEPEKLSLNVDKTASPSNNAEPEKPSLNNASVKKEVTDLGKGVKEEMVLIPSGKFTMGSPEGEKDRYKDEDQHEVTISNSFYMGKYEVTQEQWKDVMGNNPSDEKGAKLPVNNVSWDDCKEFIKKLNAKGKGGFRLPTEAEWEYAGRIGATTAYSFGDSITLKDANYGDSKIGGPVPVGSYKPNAFGLYDMHGNVWEWCEDRYGDYSKGAVTDPKGPDSGGKRVLRGGSFGSNSRYTRLAGRSSLTPDSRFVNNGFRLARTP